MSNLAQSVNQEKFKTIGQRNSFSNEKENCIQQKQTLINLIKEKEKHLNRYQIELESLQAVAGNQSLLLQKIHLFSRPSQEYKRLF